MKRLPLLTLAMAITMTLSSVAQTQPDSPKPSTPPAAEAAPKAPEAIKVAEAPPASQPIRVGGKPSHEASRQGDAWRAGSSRITTPLPEGYPRPTPPGAVEIKTYPVVRLAEVGGQSMPSVGRNFGFWKLFRHIQKNDIAMTSPVEMQYPGMTLDGGKKGDAWTMAFLYRTADLGPVGKDGEVVVRDSEKVTVLSIGQRGGYGLDVTEETLPILREHLARLEGWEACGPVRVLHYNGPDVASEQRWSEIQIPIKRTAGEPAKKSS